MKTPPMRRRAACVAALSWMMLLAASAGLGCSKTAKTSGGLEVFVASNMRTPEDFDSLEVAVRQETSPGVFTAPLLDETKSVPSQVALPASVSIASGSNADQLARIVVRGLKGQALVIERTVQVQIPTDSWLELDLLLTSNCSNVTCSGTTCIDGTCQTTIVDRSQLHPYQPGDLEGGTPSSGGPCNGSACVGADASAGGCGMPGQDCCAGSPGGSPAGSAPCASNACPTASSTSACVCVSEGSSCSSLNGPSGTCSNGACMFGRKGCGPSNCTGCCDPNDNCLLGNMPSACGLGGNSCQTCAGGAACGGGLCSGGVGPGPCGAPGQPCCSNPAGGPGCSGQSVCEAGVCVSCGQKDQPCCGMGSASGAMGYCNGTNLFCSTSSSTCTSCGGLDQPCCGGNFCQGPGLMCNGAKCAPQCGLPGNACCPYNFCSQGCCEQGTCTAQGSTCTIYGGVCASQACQGSMCGSFGQPCCTAGDGTPGCTGGNLFCRGGTCQPCGMPGSGPGANCCPGDACQGGGAVCSHDPDAGTGGNPDAGYCVWCGGYQQPCCQGDAGVGPANPGPCQTGYSCQSGTCI